VPALVEGLVREAIISDGGSTDDTFLIAEGAGTRFISGERGRGAQLARGASLAKSEWLLFLHADTILEEGWEIEVASFIDAIQSGDARPSAAAFRFRLNDRGVMPRLLEALVWLRCRLFALPYGDQGLLIPKRLYRQAGGFKPLPLMEDVDLARRLGRKQLTVLRSRAVTSARRYREDGYLLRMLRNSCCLALYYFNVPMRTLQRLYG
jgi:rSAM/selenodomain-associated transferase 2